MEKPLYSPLTIQARTELDQEDGGEPAKPRGVGDSRCAVMAP